MLLQIQKIRGEIAGSLEGSDKAGKPTVDEGVLSLDKLDDFHSQLQQLQKEKVALFISLFSTSAPLPYDACAKHSYIRISCNQLFFCFYVDRVTGCTRSSTL